MFNNSLDDKTKGPSLWVFVVGFAAAVGTSMLHQQAPEEAKSSVESSVAQY